MDCRRNGSDYYPYPILPYKGFPLAALPSMRVLFTRDVESSIAIGMNQILPVPSGGFTGPPFKRMLKSALIGKI